MENSYLIFNHQEWRHEREAKVFGFNWTDEEINAAMKSDKGLIGTKFRVDCYVSAYMPTVPVEPRNRLWYQRFNKRR